MDDHRLNNIHFLNYFLKFYSKLPLLLFTFLVFPTTERPLTYVKKVIDSPMNKEAFRATNEEKLEEKTPLKLDTSVIIDALVVKGRVDVGVGETPTDIMSDWLDTLGPYDVDSLNDGDMFRVRGDIVM